MRVMFEDEARFGRISDPRRCWAPAGVRPSIPVQIVREYEYAYAAVSPHDGVLDTLVLPQVNTDEFILMVLDGAGWHRAKQLPIPANMRLVPYRPGVHNSIPPSMSGTSCGKSTLPTAGLPAWISWISNSWPGWRPWKWTRRVWLL
jgi:hypothetical protein